MISLVTIYNNCFCKAFQTHFDEQINKQHLGEAHKLGLATMKNISELPSSFLAQLNQKYWMNYLLQRASSVKTFLSSHLTLEVKTWPNKYTDSWIMVMCYKLYTMNYEEIMWSFIIPYGPKSPTLPLDNSHKQTPASRPLSSVLVRLT